MPDESIKSILARILGSLGLANEVESWYSLYTRAAENAKVEILVLGEFNHGKSSLINMLLGRHILRTGLVPTTQVETTVGFGASEDSVTIISKDGTSERCPLDVLAGNTLPSVARIEILLAGDRFDASAQFIDTPGLNEAHELRETYVSALMERASLVIFLLDASQPATRTEISQQTRWSETLANTQRIVAVNKCDRLDEDELEEVREYIRKVLDGIVAPDDVFYVSARKEQYPGNETLIGRIHDVIAQKKNNVAQLAVSRILAIFDGRIRAALWLAQILESLPDLRSYAICDDISRPEQRLEIVRTQIRPLATWFERELEAFEREFQIAAPREIEKALIDDVEEYFGSFVHSEFGMWMQPKKQELADAAARAVTQMLFSAFDENSDAFARVAARCVPLSETNYLLLAEFGDNARPQSDDLMLEKYVILPGVYKYRLDNAKKREAGRITYCKKLLSDAVHRDLERLNMALERLAMLDNHELQRIVLALMVFVRDHAHNGHHADSIDVENIVNQLEQLQRLQSDPVNAE